MFTGIIQGTATIISIKDIEGMRTITLDFEDLFCVDLTVGASVSIDGVCLTVTTIHNSHRVDFDIILQTLITTTLDKYVVGTKVNIERAAREGVEIGGHYISGHIDFHGKIIDIRTPQNNYILRIQVPKVWMRYIFSKGYVAINGASLTVSEVNRVESWLEVWLIPETRRVTTFNNKKINDSVNIEIERGTQVVVDTVTSIIEEKLNILLPSLSKRLSSEKIIDEIFKNQLALPFIESLSSTKNLLR